MLGLTLREEFQGRRLKGTAIELANENNTGATQISAAEFLGITYPTPMWSLRWRRSARAAGSPSCSSASAARVSRTCSPPSTTASTAPRSRRVAEGLGHPPRPAEARRDQAAPEDARHQREPCIARTSSSSGTSSSSATRTAATSRASGRRRATSDGHPWRQALDRAVQAHADGARPRRVPDLVRRPHEHEAVPLAHLGVQLHPAPLRDRQGAPRTARARRLGPQRRDRGVPAGPPREPAPDRLQGAERAPRSPSPPAAPALRQPDERAGGADRAAIEKHVSEHLRLADVAPAEHQRVRSDFVEAWPFAPHLMTLLEDQVLVATQAQETRDLIRILADVFKSRNVDSPIITAADFRLDDDKSGIAALLDSVSNQHHANLREKAQRNLSAVLDAVKDPSRTSRTSPTSSARCGSARWRSRTRAPSPPSCTSTSRGPRRSTTTSSRPSCRPSSRTASTSTRRARASSSARRRTRRRSSSPTRATTSCSGTRPTSSTTGSAARTRGALRPRRHRERCQGLPRRRARRELDRRSVGGRRGERPSRAVGRPHPAARRSGAAGQGRSAPRHLAQGALADAPQRRALPAAARRQREPLLRP
jgi:hypothetical protein